MCIVCHTHVINRLVFSTIQMYPWEFDTSLVNTHWCNKAHLGHDKRCWCMAKRPKHQSVPSILQTIPTSVFVTFENHQCANKTVAVYTSEISIVQLTRLHGTVPRTWTRVSRWFRLLTIAAKFRDVIKGGIHCFIRALILRSRSPYIVCNATEQAEKESPQ